MDRKMMSAIGGVVLLVVLVGIFFVDRWSGKRPRSIQNKITMGMKSEQVIFALGSPDRRSKLSNTSEVWYYRAAFHGETQIEIRDDVVVSITYPPKK